ncbi:restriction endonuclease [Treponema peruense]|uniref:Restriction endonuclease n=1 Tax=Treponema peruense TaxID=2787628 RepID=A0A7T3REQ7_9SPIR|nr:restriction endonuclease [Treponema peruense]QQA01667.1 restriction endonuclease [Treponema peruense]
MTTGTKVFWIIFIILCFLINAAATFIKIRHIKKIREAKIVYKNINNIKNDNKGWLFSYLRKVDPFVFEELVLISFKKQGFRIKRNRQYTHDGGIDGRVRKNGKKYLIQTKRYSDYINIAHVKEFIKTCRYYKVSGYFVHTGKTGEETKELLKKNPQIKLISGEKLYEFFILDYPKSKDLFFEGKL